VEPRPSPPISASYLANAKELEEFDAKQKRFDRVRKEARPLARGLTSSDIDTYRHCIVQRKDCLRDQCMLEQTLSELFSYQVLLVPEEEPYVSILRTRRDYLAKKVREWAMLNSIWVEKWQSVKAPIEAWIQKNGQNERAPRDYRSPIKIAFRSALIANCRACNAELIAWADVNAPPELREHYKSSGNRDGSIRVAFEQKRSKHKHTIEVAISQVRKDMGIPAP